MIHPGLAALKYWDREKYAAGYGARFSEIPDFETAPHCWRCGWKDADTEALESARHKRALAEGREDHFEDTWGSLFDSGEEARANGIPFDEERTEPWKGGWIAVDINLGVLAELSRTPWLLLEAFSILVASHWNTVRGPRAKRRDRP